jgi:ABC-2 type transport system ATP-binding protein
VRRVLVRSPRLEELSHAISAAGGAVTASPDRAIEVRGLGAATIGDLAGAQGIVLHELATLGASLEDAFMDLTRDSVDFRSAKEAS